MKTYEIHFRAEPDPSQLTSAIIIADPLTYAALCNAIPHIQHAREITGPLTKSRGELAAMTKENLIAHAIAAQTAATAQRQTIQQFRDAIASAITTLSTELHH